MRYLRGPVVAFFMVIIGVAVSPINFYVEGMGYGRMIDGGGGFSITSYQSSYSVRLTFSYAAYASTEKANDEFNQFLCKAVRVIEVTPKLNEHGSLVGQRAVAIFFHDETKAYIAGVFWTDGRMLHLIDSPSLLHVIDFEKANLGERRIRFSRILYALAPGLGKS